MQGREQHSSYWGKFYIRGLEKFQVAEDFPENHRDNHTNYTGYVVVDAPAGTLFTIYEQNGDKRGTDEFKFAIAQIDDEYHDWKASYGRAFCRGNFKILVQSDSLTKAPRLMDWWIKGDGSLEYALHCGVYIQKRGVKNLPPLAK